MIKITGLDALSRQLEDAQQAIEELDGELTTVSFDPHDPGSIEAAIQTVNSVIDVKLADYVNNPIISPLAESMKEKYREAILEKASAARLEGDDADV